MEHLASNILCTGGGGSSAVEGDIMEQVESNILCTQGGDISIWRYRETVGK